jgi:hypothetical protein
MSMHIVDDEQRSDCRATPMRRLGLVIGEHKIMLDLKLS